MSILLYTKFVITMGEGNKRKSISHNSATRGQKIGSRAGGESELTHCHNTILWLGGEKGVR